MEQNTITFQLATHFLPKIALRLEYLYQTIDQSCEETHPVIHHYALKNIIEMMILAEKPELKSRFLKELMRIEHLLAKSNTSIPAELYENLHSQIQQLTQTVGRFGGNIHQDLFLQSIRMSLPSQANDYETHSPQLLLWLELNSAIRQRDLVIWLSNLRSLQATVDIYLSLLRNTAQFEQIKLLNGFYQQPLPTRIACHLILLRIEKCGIIPRMQLGPYGLSLHLCEASTLREVHETAARLDLAICQL